MSFKLSNIRYPTPPEIKSVADGILWGLGAGGGVIAAFTPWPKLGALVALLGMLAKCVSNFYSDSSK